MNKTVKCKEDSAGRTKHISTFRFYRTGVLKLLNVVREDIAPQQHGHESPEV